MPPAAQPLFQGDVHLGWLGWAQGLAGGNATKTAASLNWYLLVIHQHTHQGEMRKSTMREYIWQHLHVQNIAFLFILPKIKCVSLPFEIPHSQLEFSVVLVWIAIQFFRLSFKSLLQFT